MRNFSLSLRGRELLPEWLRSSGLSTKVLLVFISASLIPLFVLLYLDDRANSAIQSRQQLDNLRAHSIELAARIDDQLRQWQADTRVLSLDPALVAYAAGSPAASEAGALTSLNRLIRADSSERAAFLLDNSGRVTISTDPAIAVSGNMESTQLFSQAAAGSSVISDLSLGSAAPVPLLSVSEPIRNALGQVIGVAALRVSPDKIFNQFFDTRLLGQQRYAMLIDKYGVVLGTSGLKSTLYHSLGTLNANDQAQLARDQAFGNQPLPSLNLTDLSDQIVGATSPGSVTAYFSPAADNEVFGYSPLHAKPWEVVVAQPERAFLAPVDQSRNTLLLYASILAAILVAIIFLSVRLFERSERQSLHDSLTGLHNKRCLHEILQRELTRSQRNHRPLSLINADLDHFKQVNDEYGHLKGDEILKGFATVLRDEVRSIDLPVRWGGEEFLVLLPDTDKDGAIMVAEKIRRATDRVSVPRLGTMPGRRIMVSVGVATHPNDAINADELARCADQAMYLAKSLGRNQVVGYGTDTGVSALAAHPERIRLLVKNANKATIEALAAAIDARDSYTHGHSHRVADYARMIAQELDDAAIDPEKLHLAALLHDVGKIGVSDALLRKPGRLTRSEYETIKGHAQIGYEMVRGVEFLKDVAPIILHHHENFDGKGYPRGLRGKEIPLESRIIMVADTLDAMTSTRTYRESGSIETSLEELERHSRRQFDPDVVAALKQAVRKGKLKLLAEPPPTASQLQALTRLKEDAAAATAGDGKAAAESAVRATIDGEPG